MTARERVDRVVHVDQTVGLDRRALRCAREHHREVLGFVGEQVRAVEGREEHPADLEQRDVAKTVRPVVGDRA